MHISVARLPIYGLCRDQKSLLPGHFRMNLTALNLRKTLHTKDLFVHVRYLTKEMCLIFPKVFFLDAESPIWLNRCNNRVCWLVRTRNPYTTSRKEALVVYSTELR